MTIDTDLATLDEQLRHLDPWRGAVGDEALGRVETELARLRESLEVSRQTAQAEAEDADDLKRELARLRDGVREIAELPLAWGKARRMARALLADTPEGLIRP